MDAAQNARILRKEQLTSLPSLSCSLSTLPQARSLEQVQLHPSSMSAQLAAESEAKVRFALSLNTHPCLPTPSPQLRKVLSKSGTPSHPSLIVTPPPNLPSSPSPQLMMKVCYRNFIFSVSIVPNPISLRSSNPNKSVPTSFISLSVVYRLWPAAGIVSAATPPLLAPLLSLSLIETNAHLVFSLACHFVFWFSALPSLLLPYRFLTYIRVPSSCIPSIVSLACSHTFVHRRYHLILISIHSWLIISRDPGWGSCTYTWLQCRATVRGSYHNLYRYCRVITCSDTSA